MLRLTLKYKSLRLSSHVRTLHDGGIWGYQTVPPLFVLPDFTEAELANRVRNAPLLRLVESFRVRFIPLHLPLRDAETGSTPLTELVTLPEARSPWGYSRPFELG